MSCASREGIIGTSFHAASEDLREELFELVDPLEDPPLIFGMEVDDELVEMPENLDFLEGIAGLDTSLASRLSPFDDLSLLLEAVVDPLVEPVPEDEPVLLLDEVG